MARVYTEEQKKRRKEYAKEYFSDPVNIKKRNEYFSDPVNKKRISERHKKYHADPVHIKKRNEYLKKCQSDSEYIIKIRQYKWIKYRKDNNIQWTQEEFDNIDWSKDLQSQRFHAEINSHGYPYEWNEDLRESIRKRDGYKCQDCGTTQEEHLEIRNQRLSTHHVDGNKLNSDPTNLKTLCKSCHIKINHEELIKEP